MVRGQRRRLSAALVLIPPALEALRRGLVIAPDSRNRVAESALAQTLSRLEAAHGDPVAALDHVTLAIRNYHHAGNTTLIINPLAAFAALFDRLGRYEPAATIAGFADNPFFAKCLNPMALAMRTQGVGAPRARTENRV